MAMLRPQEAARVARRLQSDFSYEASEFRGITRMPHTGARH